MARIKVRGFLIGFIPARISFESFEINLWSLYSPLERQFYGQLNRKLKMVESWRMVDQKSGDRL